MSLAEIWSLCRAITPLEQAFTESEHGDSLWLLDWLNEPARRGAANGGTPAFPAGSAIVKEKLRRDEAGAFRVAALGVMVKQPAGFDPAHGDWEYGYWEAATGLQSDAAATRHCGDCHNQAASDRVFLDMRWRQ